MSHEVGRERHMTYSCEKCGRAAADPLTHNPSVDEYWCDFCIDSQSEIDRDLQFTYYGDREAFDRVRAFIANAEKHHDPK